MCIGKSAMAGWLMILASALAQIHGAAMPACAQSAGSDAKPFRFGAFEQTLTGLSLPMCAAIADDGTIFVADAGDHQIVVFDRSGQRLRAFGKLGSTEGELRGPASLAIGGDGLIYVADTGNHRVQVFTSAGEVVRGWGARGRGAHEFCAPQGISVHGERVYVADTGNQRIRIKVFDLMGQVVLDLGSDPTEETFRQPVDVAVDGADRMFVLDADRNSVTSFDSSGNRIISWGDYGPFRGLLNNPQDIETFAGQVLVNDTNNHRVQVFSGEGEALRQWGVHDITQHEGQGRIHYPQDLAIGGGATVTFAVFCEPL
jgi:DNA-binding beta-propeller fold protein YncE